MEIFFSFELTVKSVIKPCFLSFSRILTEYFDKGAEIVFRPARLPFLILINKSQERELIIGLPAGSFDTRKGTSVG